MISILFHTASATRGRPHPSVTDVASSSLPEIPRLRSDRVEMKIWNVDVPDFDRARGSVARIRRPAAMEFVAAPVGQGEGLAPVADRSEQGRCVMKSGRDDVDYVAFTLNLAVDDEHGG